MFDSLSIQEQEAIIKLYMALLSRAPEWEGANYWARELQKLDGAMSVDQKMDSIADRMLSDAYKFTATGFTADMPLEDFIKNMYLSALGRGESAISALGRKAAPKRDEIDYWIDEISSGRETRASFGLRIFRDSEIFAEGGAAPEEEIAKYKFQSAFNATRLAIAKEFVTQENSGELQSDQAIIAGREVLKGVPMIRLEDTALSQYITRKLAAPEDPSLYERVPPLSASSLVAEITAVEAAAVGGGLPIIDGPSFASPLAGGGASFGSAAAPAGGGGAPSSLLPPPSLPPPPFLPPVPAPPPISAIEPTNVLRSPAPSAHPISSQPAIQPSVQEGHDPRANTPQMKEPVTTNEMPSGGETDDENSGMIDSAGEISDPANNDEGALENNTPGNDEWVLGTAGDDRLSGNINTNMDGLGGVDTLVLHGDFDERLEINLNAPADSDQLEVGRSSETDASQRNFENVDLSRVVGDSGAHIIAHRRGSTITASRYDDIIESGIGADILSGGQGRDIFIFNEGNLRSTANVRDENFDIITDFTPSDDRLGFSENTQIATSGMINVDAGLHVAVNDTGEISFGVPGLGLAEKFAIIRQDSRFASAGTAAFFTHHEASAAFRYIFRSAATDSDIIIRLPQLTGAGRLEKIHDAVANRDYFHLTDNPMRGNILYGTYQSALIGEGYGSAINLTGFLPAGAVLNLNISPVDQLTFSTNDNQVVQRGFSDADLSRVTGNGATIIAASFVSIITGSQYADIFRMGAGSAFISGGQGNDRFIAGSGAARILDFDRENDKILIDISDVEEHAAINALITLEGGARLPAGQRIVLYDIIGNNPDRSVSTNGANILRVRDTVIDADTPLVSFLLSSNIKFLIADNIANNIPGPGPGHTILVLHSDGGNSYLSALSINAETAEGNPLSANQLSAENFVVNTLVSLTGISQREMNALMAEDLEFIA